jgi:branched-subunit amino acid transport protein
VSVVLVPLAFLMGLATYPSRAIPLLVPGMNRLPASIQLYLRLVGPSVLGALAAVNVMVSLDSVRRPSFHVGFEWLAVGLCIAIVAWRKNLFLGLVAAVALIAAARAMGLAPLP